MKLFLKSLLLTLALVLLGSTSSAYAVLIEHDFKNTEDKLITYDSATGLEWLDLTVTQGRFSFDSIQSELTSGGEFQGFRYATLGEVESLLSSFGLIRHGLSDSANDRAQIEYYYSLFGITQTDIDISSQKIQNHYAFGLFNEVGPEDFVNTHYYTFILENFGFGYTEVERFTWPDFRVDNSLGHYLVRSTVIPEPSSLILTLLGVATLVLFAWRKRVLSA